MRNAAKQAMKWLFTSGVVLGFMLAAVTVRAALVTVSGSETWDGVANPHSAEGVTLSQAGGVSTYTIPNGMTIGASGVIGLGTVNTNVTLSFAPGGGGLTLNGQINLSSGLRNFGVSARTFTLAMNNNSITGIGDIVCTYASGNTQNKHNLSITGTGNVSFDDIDLRHSDGGPGGTVDINVGGSVTLDTVNTSDDSAGGDAAENVTIRGSAVTVGAISAFAVKPTVDNGNVTLEALAYPGFSPSDNVNNTPNNSITLTGAIDVEGSTTDQGGGNVTIRGVVVNLGAGFTCPPGTVYREADSALSIFAGAAPGQRFLDESSDPTAYSATLNVEYVRVSWWESQTFDSAASAASNGWVAMDGDGPANSDGGADLQAGWSGTEVAISELAGDQSGEGRVRGSRGANTEMTYYADTTLGVGYLTFSSAFVASGRMDFGAFSGSDYIGTAFTLGFFDRRAALSSSAFKNANYLAVGFSFDHNPNAQVRMAIQRSDAAGSVTCSVASATTLGVSVGNDLLFAFRYDPTAGANGQGRLSGTITDASTLGVTSFSIDLTAANRTALAGGVLNSFGLVKPRAGASSTGYADWHFDDVTYGVPPSGTAFTFR